MKTSKGSVEENSHPRVGVGVLLVDGSGNVLLTLRTRPPEAGCWSIVGGKLDYLETLEACAVREAREEAGLKIVIERLLCVTNHLLPKEKQHWVSPAYLGRILAGRAHNCEPDKTRDVRWFPLDHLPPNLTMTRETRSRRTANSFAGRSVTRQADAIIFFSLWRNRLQKRGSRRKCWQNTSR